MYLRLSMKTQPMRKYLLSLKSLRNLKKEDKEIRCFIIGKRRL